MNKSDILNFCNAYSRPFTYKELIRDLSSSVLSDNLTQDDIESLLNDLVLNSLLFKTTVNFSNNPTDSTATETSFESNKSIVYWSPDLHNRKRTPEKIQTQPSKDEKSEKEEKELKELKAKLLDLKTQLGEIQKEIGSEVNIENLHALHIKRMHDYNEIKDAGQLVLGKLAELSGKTTKEMYEQFELDLDD
ncbi:swi5-like zinc finger protein [Nowakowskiella sp. JEL0407]|nr:swi5-like zinc finger protein [Nowakowskiella sp. JEL0407]